MGLASEVETIILKSNTFGKRDCKMTLRSLSFKSAESGTKMTSICSCQEVLPDILNFKGSEMGCIAHEINAFDDDPMPTHSCNLENDQIYEQNSVKGLSLLFSPRPRRELDAAAVMLQKVYKSYRTRRNLADCAVVVEELWWKALDFASLEHSSISFFNVQKPETAISRWARARTRAAKVGKGLSKNNKAQKLALRHWLEAIDPRHRYGHNLHFYYDVWFDSESTQPFFYWLDVGGGKEVNLEKCPRIKLQQQCIKYLGPNEREKYEVIFKNGNLVYKQSEMFVNTDEGSKWIFVLSTSRALYVGQKIKGKFQHSSFLAGGATTSAGRLVVKEGILKAVWPYSGHYLPTEENFKDFINFLIENNVDLSDVKRCPTDEDEIDDNKSFKKRSLDDEYPSFKNLDIEPVLKESGGVEVAELPITTNRSELQVGDMEKTLKESNNAELATDKEKELTKHLSYKWSTGAGPRIGCVRDYPVDLQSKALEQVNLSPRIPPSPIGAKGPIPSPRPSPALRLSPRLVYMAFPTPTKKITLTLPKPKRK